ncbi:hypothetical protein CBR_g11218 [Chara braunii]|uniref:Uncharacterized protein n=1 Tax=Chara braunii TaxID=69332 RepID=A0A388KQD7_CHABU|nr:hypothetical protein CBR_g11218 [Chara braunii]|eukprot:GBG72290.1 hypothetical protein CBR_g11218 [Chara braunii]
MKQEIKQLRVSALTKGSFEAELEDQRTEVSRLKIQSIKDKEKAELWKREALRPGNKRGNIVIGTPECPARGLPRPRWTGNLRDSDKWRQEYLKMKELHRAACFEAQVLKDKRVVAEGEVVKLKEQLNKQPDNPSQNRVTEWTNPKTRMEEAATRSSRKGKKVTPRRCALDNAAPTDDINERFSFIEEQKKDLLNYKKSGLEVMCKEAGLNLRAVDLMIANLAEFRADKAFGRLVDKGKTKENEASVQEVPDDYSSHHGVSTNEEDDSAELYGRYLDTIIFGIGLATVEYGGMVLGFLRGMVSAWMRMELRPVGNMRRGISRIWLVTSLTVSSDGL